MSGRAALIPTVKLTITLPADLYSRVQAELWSPAEGKVPKGSWQRFLSARIMEYYREIEGNQNV